MGNSTPTHTFRAPGALWEAAKARAGTENRSLTEVLVGFLRQYAEQQVDSVNTCTHCATTSRD